MRAFRISLAIIGIACAVVFWWHWRIERDWDAVQVSLVRLQAGISMEPQILLRKTVADADAQLKIFTQRHPLEARSGRVIAAELAIHQIKLAFDGLPEWDSHELDKYPFDGQRHKFWWNVQGLNEIDGKFLTPVCIGRGTIRISGLKGAHIAASQQLLSHALVGASLPEINALDVEKIEASCFSGKHRN